MATDFFQASPHLLAESQPWCVSVRSASHTKPQVFIHKQLVGLIAAESLSFTKWRTASPLITPTITWLRPLLAPPTLTTPTLAHGWGKKSMGAVPPSLSAQLLTFLKFRLKKERKRRQETLSFHDNNNFCCGTCICGRWRLRSLKINSHTYQMQALFLN